MSTVKRFSVFVCMLALASAIFMTPALAVSPIALSNGYITDQADVLNSNDTNRAESALDGLNDAHGLQLFFVYVDSFSGMDSQDWADQTAIDNGLGLNDLLIAVAVDDQQYAWSVDSDFPLTDAQLSRVAAEYVEPELQANDWVGAAVAAADGFDAVISNQSGSATSTTPSASTSASSGAASSLSWLLPLIILLAVVAIVVFLIIRSRRAKGAAEAKAQPETLSTKELGTRAGKLLVEVDDAIQSSEQELGFAEAEFGEEAVKEYSEVLKAAKKDVAEAFHLQQSVFDSTPEDENTKRQMLMRIIELATNADARLDEKAEGFVQLRALAERVDEVIPTVTQRISTHEITLETASRTLAVLKTSYLLSALGEVADDDVQAEELLDFAKKTITEAGEENAKGEKYTSAVLVRSAENAIAQVERLLAAITAAHDNLAKETSTLQAEINQLEQTAASADSRGSADLSAAARTARDFASQARAALASPPFDPLVQLNKLRAATTQLSTVLEAIERAKAAYATASATITSARDRIGAVESFIITRRGAIGSEARSGLQEAKNRLLRAEQLLASDAGASLAEAQAAMQYADRASQWAQTNVESYNPSPFPTGGAPVQIPDGSQGGLPNIAGSFAGALIAGVLQDVLSGGGSSGRSGAEGRKERRPDRGRSRKR